MRNKKLCDDRQGNVMKSYEKQTENEIKEY